MQFIISKFNYEYKFVDEDNKATCFKASDVESISLDGFFTDLDSPNEQTRELLHKRNLNSSLANATQKIFIRVNNQQVRDDFAKEHSLHPSYPVNTLIELDKTETSTKIICQLYVSPQSFSNLKNLINVIPNSNSYSHLDFTVVKEDVLQTLPLSILFYASCDGIKLSLPVQQPKPIAGG
jgi:hypothetical protein